MLTALRQNPARRRVSQGHSLPAPVGGLNGRDPITSMSPKDATVLKNWFPEANNVALRRGFTSHATGMTTAVDTLMTYHAINGSEKLFAAANNKIYDVTSAGAATEVYATSITSNRWQWFDFSTTAQLYVCAFNGVDTPVIYNGSGWTTTSITGSVTTSTLIGGCVHNERQWLIQKNTLNAWYLAAGAIGGAATKFPMTSVFELGGQLMAVGTMSVTDTGDGMDDVLVFVSDVGEAVIYAGTDPASASTWTKKGNYRIGEPLGRRCVTKLGGDLIVLTNDGATSMRQIMTYDRSQENQVAVTAKISDLFNDAARSYGDHFGWQAIIYPKNHSAIFNVPDVEGSRQTQYVQNTITGAWCSFADMNANCWALLNDELYFGGNSGVVYKADTGYSDNGSNINADMKGAFSYFGSRGQNKLFSMIRPLLLTSGDAGILIGVNVDFDNVQPTGTLTPSTTETGVWQSGLWGTAKWGGAGILVRDWKTIGRIGFCAAPRLKVSTNGARVYVNGFDIVSEAGGQL